MPAMKVLKKSEKRSQFFWTWSVRAILLLALAVFFIFYPIGGLKPESPSNPSPTISPTNHEFHLSIPSLGIEAPVIADIDGADQVSYFTALENGVAHLKGSSKPGEGSNIFIFGHSSYYWYKPGNYKEIFRNLEDLQANDEIIIGYKGQEYKYKVTSKKTVDPSQVDVIRQTTQEQVSLMTCVPPGTTLKRLIVVAVKD